MKKILYLVMSAVLFAACASEDIVESDYGYLQLDDIAVDSRVTELPLTKLVEGGMRVQICQDGQVLPEHDYAPGTLFDKRFLMPAGTYTVKAFTDNHEEAASGDLGKGAYSVESEPFQVEKGSLTTISLVAPLLNTAVRVAFAPLTLTDFPDINVTITSVSGRTVTVAGAKYNNVYCYFDVPADGRLTYEIKMTNADGQAFSIPGVLEDVKAGHYEIKVDVQ